MIMKQHMESMEAFLLCWVNHAIAVLGSIASPVIEFIIDGFRRIAMARANIRSDRGSWASG